MTGTDESEHVEVVDEDPQENQPSEPAAAPTPDGADPDKKKEKVPNFSRQMKAKLQKTLDTTDEECVIVSQVDFYR
jgi:hypothetical protein